MQPVDVALAYRKRGFRVFACRPNKAPATPRGVHDATTDANEIRQQFASAGPNALVGIACGQQPNGLHLMAVDLDQRPLAGVDGRDSWQTLASGRKQPDTWEVLTPSGGAHLYYMLDSREAARVKNSVAKLGPGIDIRAEGGYVIAAGSSTPDGKQWSFDGNSPSREPARAPQWLVEAVSAKPTLELVSSREEAPSKIVEGEGRNDYLARIAGRLANSGLGRVQIDAMLRAENERVCDPPVSEAELRRTVMRSAAGWIATRDTAPLADQSPEELTYLEHFTATEWASVVKAPQWITPGFIEAFSLNIMLGGWGSGKTLIMLDYMLRLAAGMPWQGRLQKPKLVVLVEAEGQSGVQRRIKAWAEHHNNGEIPAKLVIIPQAVLIGGRDQQELILSQTLDQIEREHGEEIALVALDTYARSFGSPQGENDNSAVSVWVNLNQNWVMVGRRALVVLHHPGHAEKGRGRGGSALVGAADTEWLLESSGGNYRRLSNTKSKDGEPGQTFYWRFFAITIKADDGTPMSVVCCEEATEEQYGEQEDGEDSSEAARNPLVRGKVQGMLMEAYRELTSAFREEVECGSLIDRAIKNGAGIRKNVTRALLTMIESGAFEVSLGDEEKTLTAKRVSAK